MPKINKNLLMLLFAAALFVAIFRLDAVTLFDVDEAVFSTATKEMVESGDWITPTYNGEVRYDKPIFFYWLMAASYKTFGVNEFGARFPSAMAGFILALSLFYFARRACNETTAFYATIAVSISAYFLVYSRSAVTDMVMSLFITLSLFSFYLAVSEERRFIYGFYLFSAIAFLTKGLIGIVFPFGIAVIYMFMTERFRGLLKIFDLKAALLFLLVAVPWYAAEFAINGDEFFQQFFIKHHFRRYTDVISGHKGPFYYYIITLLVGMSPWIAFMPAGIWKAIKERAGILLFAAIWFVVVFVFFSFSTTKLPNYILSALPPAAILIATGMADQNICAQRAAWLVIAIGALAAAIGMLFLPPVLIRTGIPDTDWTMWASAILIAMSAVAFYSVRLSRPLYAPLAGVMFALLIFLLTSALPAANQYMQSALHKFSVYAKDNARGDERIICYGINNPSIVFYSGHKVANIRGRESLAAHVKEKQDRLAIAKVKDEDTLKEAGFRLLQKEGGYALFERN
jgi:4-amino-4-deoxy-L-arabinose transferase-like glycosyltransferase